MSETAILAAGTAAAEHTKIWAADHETLLRARFRKEFADRAKKLPVRAEEIRQAAQALLTEDEQIFETGRTGFYDTLWSIGEAYCLGLDVDAYAVPIRQETIEVCECAGKDPFEIASKGLVLFTTKRPGMLIELLQRSGISAVRIGRLSDRPARIVHFGERERFLKKPAQSAVSLTRGAHPVRGGSTYCEKTDG